MPATQSSIQKVYCAGPLFNVAERDEMTLIADALCAAGYEVYLPHRDGMEFRLILGELEDRGWNHHQAGSFLHEAIFALDVYQLAIDCDCMVWNLNGRVPDEGAVSEAAIAWSLGKPLIGFCNDARSLIAGRINPLLIGLVDFQSVSKIEEIAPKLDQELQSTALPEINPDALPERFRKTVADGKRLWDAIETMGAKFDNGRIATIVIQLFAPEVEAHSQ